jgi:hypothetical protein
VVQVQTGKTVMGKPFKYDGSLEQGLTVYFTPPSKAVIPLRIINVIRSEIATRSPVLMGANRKPLVHDSVGETLLLEHKTSPQVMSYVLPLLVEEGFCTLSMSRPYIIRKR